MLAFRPISYLRRRNVEYTALGAESCNFTKIDKIQGVEAHQRASSIPHFQFLWLICDVIQRNCGNMGRSNRLMCVIMITEITNNIVSSH
jgi:hypothetical protein